MDPDTAAPCSGAQTEGVGQMKEKTTRREIAEAILIPLTLGCLIALVEVLSQIVERVTTVA